MRKQAVRLAVLIAVALATTGQSCSGGGGGGGSVGSLGGAGAPGLPAAQTCDGSCAQESLTVLQVNTIIGQAVAEADVYGEPATIAVVDRVGNVLAVFEMAGADPFTTVRSGKNLSCGTAGLDGCTVRSSAAVISKAGTAAYLSSQGNAFTTRTASQIVQEHFNPGEDFQAGGPLFGVQFSQLPCGDLVRRSTLDMSAGPKRMPLGFSADPGGIPLYINGVPVGGVGIEFDGEYGADPDTSDIDTNLEERIAIAASAAFDAPPDRRADRIAVLGKFLRFADDEAVQSASSPILLPALPPGGTLISAADPNQPDFYDRLGGVLAGTEFLTAASGVVDAGVGYDGSGQPAEILFDPVGMVPYPAANPRDSTSPVPAGGLTAFEVRTIVIEALKVAERARAQIRRPAGSAVRVNVSVVDLAGELLGFARSPDAPIFGTDVSLQKARTAAFFSRVDAGAELIAADPIVLGGYVVDIRAFLSDPTALANGIAFSDRAGGNLSRPFFPDGIDGKPNGPFSKPIAEFSPFNNGLQLDLVAANVLMSLADDTIVSCPAAGLEELANGIQIFPGSVPIFKSGVLVGGIGVSGDGVDQDDLVAFLGLHNAGLILGIVGNAPVGIRADTISVDSVNLRYVSCPPSPFLGGSGANVCEGL